MDTVIHKTILILALLQFIVCCICAGFYTIHLIRHYNKSGYLPDFFDTIFDAVLYLLILPLLVMSPLYILLCFCHLNF